MIMKVTVAALLFQVGLQTTSTSAFVVSAPRPAALGLYARKPGAADTAEEDLMLTLKVIMDHAERSTTVGKEQYISQMEEQKKIQEEEIEPFDISIPYDAPARLAYEKTGSPGDYDAFKIKFEEDAIADVIAKNAPPVDISVPYDAAAKLAYEAAGNHEDYQAFKTKYEQDAVAYVISKKAPQVKETKPESIDISIPYDAPARLAFEKAGSPGDYSAFKEKYEADAIADVIGKQAKSEAVAA